MYVFAVHTLNRLAEVKAGKLNDPNRTEFYQQYRGILQAGAPDLRPRHHCYVAESRLGPIGIDHADGRHGWTLSDRSGAR